MWFKNISPFRIAMNGLSAAKLAEELAKHPLTEPGAMDAASYGFVPDGDGGMVYSQNDCMLIAFAASEKLLPSSVVKEATAKRAAEIEEQQGFKLGRKQMRELAEQIAYELLPRAFVRTRVTRAWIDAANRWLFVDSGTASKAEELVEALSRALPDIGIKLLRTNQTPSPCMTNWISCADTVPSSFTVDMDAELRAVDDSGAKVRHVSRALDGSDTAEQITAGMMAFKLGMTWQDRVSFVLDDAGRIKRLHFLDIVKDNADEAESAEEQMAIDFTIMTGEVAALMDDLVDALGGEMEDAK